MNIATLTTIEEILDETRPADATDYAEWGRRAGVALADHRDEATVVLVEAMTARARQRVAREQTRTRDGMTRFIADATTGQMTAWPESTDAVWLREIGLRLIKEGDKKSRLGRLILQADLRRVLPPRRGAGARGCAAARRWVFAMSERNNIRATSRWATDAVCDEPKCEWFDDGEECREEAKAHTMMTGHTTAVRNIETRYYSRYALRSERSAVGSAVGADAEDSR